jgi:phospholipid/cholesterol/gamma-HCH transport system substrate-binding protein
MFDVKKELAWSKLKVGIVITVALVTLLVTVFFAGNIENMISHKTMIKIDIRDVRGLRKGSPVWYAGLEVGSVKSIDLHPIYGTVVSVLIKRDVLGYLKKDSRATVQTMGLLGDKYIEFSSGSPGAAQLQAADMVEGDTEIGVQDVIATGTESLRKLTNVAEQLSRFIDMIGEGEGTVPQLIKDPSLYNNLKDVSQRLSDLVAGVQQKKGTLGKLVGDDLLYNKLLSATESVEAFSSKLNTSHGTVRRLIEDSTLYDRLLGATTSLEEFSLKLSKGPGTLNRLAEDGTLYDKLLGATTSLEEFSVKLSKGPGTLNRLAEDPDLYENLKQASGHLSSILNRVDSGEGTAGALIRDEKLAQELKDTIRELKELTADIKENPKKYFKFSVF